MIKSLKNNFKLINANEEWVIEEKGKKASLKIAKLKYSSDIISIENSVYSGWNNLLKSFCNNNETHWIEDLDCDGVAILETDEKKYIFLLELKSKFDTKKIFEAYRQICYTLFKIHMLLSYCKEYYSNNVNAMGVISCIPPNKKQKSAIIEKFENLSKIKNIDDEFIREIKFTHNFYNIDSRNFDKKFKFKIKNIELTKGIELPSKLQNMSIDLSLVFAETEKSSEVNIALDRLI